MKRWQKILGLEAWEITLTRKSRGEDVVYPGLPEEARGFHAGYCMTNSHGLQAEIYIAPERMLAEQGLDAEKVLVHELLHLRLDGLCMIPPTEEVGRALVLENTIAALARALVGTKIAA